MFDHGITLHILEINHWAQTKHIDRVQVFQENLAFTMDFIWMRFKLTQTRFMHATFLVNQY